MTLAEHQAANPDYDVWQRGDITFKVREGDEALYAGSWWRIGRECGEGVGFYDQKGYWVSAHVLAHAGATFRRKKEWKNEFLIEAVIHPAWAYSVDGEPRSLADFLLDNGIKRARLVVEEWE